MAASKQVTALLQKNLLQREKLILKLQEENKHLRQEVNKPLQEENLALSWKISKAAPCRMSRGSATVQGSMAYFRSAFRNQLHLYNSDTQEWSILPECPREHFTLAVVNDLVTAVGGVHFDHLTNTLFSLMVGGEKKKWVKYFPPMPTKRKDTAVICNEKALVVAGGLGVGYSTLTTVEVMDTDTLQWSTASSLPQPLSDATATICGDRIYLVGGRDVLERYPTKTVFTCSLNALLMMETKRKTLSLAGNHPVWHTIADLPVKNSTCATLNGQLLAVGGYEPDGEDTSNVYLYNTQTNSWEIISHMPTPRRKCLVTVLPDNKLIVVGGETDAAITDKVEIASVDCVL